MDQLLKGLPMVCGYLDDILVSGKTKEDHADNVRAVLKRLDETGIRANEETCRFGLEKYEYLGYIINVVEKLQKKLMPFKNYNNQTI